MIKGLKLFTKSGILAGVGSQAVSKAGGSAAPIGEFTSFMSPMANIYMAGKTMKMVKKLK